MSDYAPVAEILNRLSSRAVDLGRQVPGESDLVAFILIRVPKLGGCISAGEVAAAAGLTEELIRSINNLIARSPDHADFVSAMMADMNELGLAGKIWDRPAPRTSQPPEDKAKHPRTGEGIVYSRRQGPDGQMVLVESRPEAKARDFYVRQKEYDRAVKALTSVAVRDGVKFPVIHDAYSAGSKANAYPLRVLLRFWRSLDPPLVERERSRYRVVGSATRFRKVAKAAWAELPEK